MKPAQFLFLIVFLPIYSFGQAIFKPGVIVNLKGDTLHGFIEYKNWENNPVEIRFRADSLAPIKKYTNKELKYFNVWLGYPDEYVQYQGPVSTNEVTIDNLSTTRDTSFRMDTVLLKVIQRGKNLSLFLYTDKIKSRYFISRKAADVPEELIYRIYYLEDENGYNKTKYNNVYQSQLYIAGVNANMMTEGLKAEITRAFYNENNIIKIVSKINGIAENDKANTHRKITKPIIKVFAAAAGVAVIIWTFQQFSIITPIPTH